ncbi:MAG: ABC transporter ATP-binding protein [Alphaproteobacteria bacterium]|nr:ABC transporter ATP-binding protein [Alphaproteobacteria bacterium]
MIRLETLAKSYGGVHAVDGVSLQVEPGEFFSLLGGSGCGKTTLLRLIAGLEKADSGRIVIDGIDMTDAPAYERPVNTVFQSYALFPHMTVARNVAFGLHQERVERREIDRRVDEILHLVHLEDFSQRKPHELSGGQKQRVALARALVKRPKILLLDEPLAALDRKLREKTRFELKTIQRNVGTTFVMVTHDQDEALSLSSRIAVMDAGRIVQLGSPRDIYYRPSSVFVADFVGNANWIEGTVVAARDGTVAVKSSDGNGNIVVACTDPIATGGTVRIMVRPERITLAPIRPAADENAIHGTIANVAFLGDSSLIEVRLASGQSFAVRTLDRWSVATEVWLTWRPNAGVLLNR